MIQYVFQKPDSKLFWNYSETPVTVVMLIAVMLNVDVNTHSAQTKQLKH